MIEKDIADAIEKNLPAVTAGVLKKRLEEVERLETLVRNQKETIETKDTQILSFSKQANATIERIAALEAQLKTFKEREEMFKLSEQSIEAAHRAKAIAEAKLEGSMEVTRLVFGNIKLRERIYGQEPMIAAPVKDQYGNTSYGIVTPGQVDKTKETEL